MCSPPNVVDMYIHSLRDKLDQGFSRPLMKTVCGVGDKIEASQGNMRTQYLIRDFSCE